MPLCAQQRGNGSHMHGAVLGAIADRTACLICFNCTKRVTGGGHRPRTEFLPVTAAMPTRSVSLIEASKFESLNCPDQLDRADALLS